MNDEQLPTPVDRISLDPVWEAVEQAAAAGDLGPWTWTPHLERRQVTDLEAETLEAIWRAITDDGILEPE